jgi:hypothetical protein
MNTTPWTLTLLLLLATARLSAQSSYESNSFEAPRFKLGTLAGVDLWSGQDGWLVTDNGGSPAPVGSIAVQKKVVRSGTMAVTWDAASYKVKKASFAHLRTNKIFNYSGELDVEIDLRMDQIPNKDGTIWGLSSQYAPHPMSTIFYWIVVPSGEIWMLQGTAGVKTHWVKTGVILKRFKWYHARTVVDSKKATLKLYVDGKSVGKAFKPIYFSAAASHAFTAIVLQDPDKGKLHFDNFRVRERKLLPSLTSDLILVPSGRRARIGFRLHPGQLAPKGGYVLLGSLSGRKPGLKLPGGKLLPLNYDAFTTTVLLNLNTQWFQNFAGSFDAQGWARATWDSQTALPGWSKGLTLDFAYLSWPRMDLVSEAWSVQIR